MKRGTLSKSLTNGEGDVPPVAPGFYIHGHRRCLIWNSQTIDSMVTACKSCKIVRHLQYKKGIFRSDENNNAIDSMVINQTANSHTARNGAF